MEIMKEGAKLVLVTLGKNGAFYCYKKSSSEIITGTISVPEVQVVKAFILQIAL